MRPDAPPTSGLESFEAVWRGHRTRHHAHPEYQLTPLVGCTPAQVRRLLVAATGLPPHALHLQRRIRRGKALLARGMPVTQVAQATGFGDQAHFTRHFTVLVGVSPARYAARR